MPPAHQPANRHNPVHIAEIACRTALGNADETVAALLEGTIALKHEPVYGEDGGEAVPLALRGSFSETLPPRWWTDLREFMAPLAGNGWGSARLPVFLTSSNFGIDGLYGLGRNRESRYKDWATPHACAAHIRREMGWGSNMSILSHACVSAQLGLWQAAQWIGQDLADAALVLSFDYVGPFVAAGFNSLKILNTGMPAPYQDQETGSIGLGDGTAYAVLTKAGDGPCIAAQSLYNEMYHFTANEPEGSGFEQCLLPLKEALAARSCWIKGHGTGTLEAGRLEAVKTHEILPGSPLVSWKGSLGHTLGSCALVELAVGLAAARAGNIPGTVGTTGPCYSPEVATAPFPRGERDSVLMLSNAFGGSHAAMIVDYA